MWIKLPAAIDDCYYIINAVVTNPDVTYLWQDGSTDQTYTVTQSGTYHITVCDGLCCDEDTVIVICESDCITPPVSFDIEQPPCCGDNAVITYTGPGLGSETGVDLIDLPQAKMKRLVIFKIIKEQFHLKFYRPTYLMKALLRTSLSKYRQEIVFSHLNFHDFNRFIKLINNPPDLF